MPKIELARISGDYGFEATDASGHVVKMDSSPESGGQDYGVRPMQILLMGLAGCSAIDVLSILKKQRQEVHDYKMVVNGDREPNVEPSLWKAIEVEFHLYGNIDPDKAQKAADLSIGKYCSVAATLTKAGADIKYKVFVHPIE
jgi:putative redox protein